VNITKQLKTRAGSEVKIFATDYKNPRPYIGAYYTGEEWIPVTWRRDGFFNNEKPCALDLEEAE
jgi:hypothetical protein